MKIDAEKSKFLTDRLKVRVLPTLVLLRDNKTVGSLWYYNTSLDFVCGTAY